MDKLRIVRQFKDKKILIIGLGREGLDSFLFFRRLFPKTTIGLADKSVPESLGPVFQEIISKDKNIELHLGADYLKAVKRCDLAVKAPGVPIHLPEIEEAYAAGKIVWQTKIFFDLCPGTIIGITGTKGKSTTSSLVYAVLNEAKKPVKLLGNIGKPILTDLLTAQQKDYFVLELSSHQLFNLDKSPHIAVLLNLFEEHLDYYRDFSEYARAKANIAMHQSEDDFLIYNSENPDTAAIAKTSKAQKIAFNGRDWDFKAADLPLVGDFNYQNAKIAAIVGEILKINKTTIETALKNFKPLEHRLESVGIFNGIEFYNDSLSTIQESAIAAIDGLGERVVTLIAGGYDRNQPFGKLAEKILDSKIGTLVLFPTTGKRILKEVETLASSSGRTARYKDINIFFAASMDEAVRAALDNTASQKIALMSCASSSFSLFKNYEEKARMFKESLKANAKTKG
jgi:UDP-N-acetylmuramoylalanine--D-glutamate ligase